MSDSYCYVCLSEDHSLDDCIFGAKLPRIPSNKFCYICFSKNHSFVECIYDVPNLSLPNIDQDLFSRFLELLVIEEKLLLMFTYPTVFISLPMKPVKVKQTDNLFQHTLIVYENTDLVIADKATVFDPYFDTIKSRIAFRVEHLEILSPFPPNSRLKLSSNELFLLLTYKTKFLQCRNIQFNPIVSLQQITEAAPALGNIDIYRTNVEVDYSWPDLLSELKNLKTISLAVSELNINVENLAALMRENKNVLRIYLYFIVPVENNFSDSNGVFLAIKKQLSPHFVQTRYCASWTYITISFKYAAEKFGQVYSIQYELKKNKNNSKP